MNRDGFAHPLKLAGRSKAGKSVNNFVRASDALRRGATLEESIEQVTALSKSNHTRLANSAPDTLDVLDDSHSEFFAEPSAVDLMNESELAALDAMIEAHGTANVLATISKLLDTRVDEAQLVNGRLFHHLAREDSFAYVAERILSLSRDPRVKEL